MAMARDKSGAMLGQCDHTLFVFRGPWRVSASHRHTLMIGGGWWEAALGDGVFVYQQRRQPRRQCVMDARAAQCRQPVSDSCRSLSGNVGRVPSG